ncbi:hypothetical protein [Hyphomicrobium sp.]|uniref:hypothetical protein n=1 Tax=Hyphomicrobium sp. TaxID=82 RepID=UPI0025C282AC|nr:hypothetical protein [Hyphomicrobium sp.]MCC7250622.1 hypothetical protein [Hyphomicrobium sp.]
MTVDARSEAGVGSSAVNSTLWIALIAGLSVGGSYVYACAAPLAAIAALAALKMDRGTGFVLVITAWLANQLVGYLILDYPQTLNSFAWGGAIGLAAVAGFLAARSFTEGRANGLFILVAALFVSFVFYETALYAAGFVLGSSEEAFSTAVVGRILAINAVSFAGLLVLHRAAIALRWLRPSAAPAHA